MSSLHQSFADAGVCESLERARPLLWLNPQESSNLESLPLSGRDLADAQARWDRLVPLLAHLFPSEAPTGRIASDLVPAPSGLNLGLGQGARAFIKKDSHLPVCASVKARGGLYEVFCRAEKVALEQGLLSVGEDYSKLATSPEIRAQLQRQEVAVGSTGNLGMSVGLAAAGLGMRATVHMSVDAKAWKKALLRSRGVNVVEHAGLYQEAVAAGRKLAEADPSCHFVDDESSTTLFCGYSAAGRELQMQLAEQGVEVSASQPLVVHIPCGVGGAPGGILWGLKSIFGDSVRVFFAEPTHAPCVTAGLASGLHDGISVQDLGLDGRTEADGLAVQRPSGLACDVASRLLAGCYTVEDGELFAELARLVDAGGDFLEVSCAAGLLGPRRLALDPRCTELLGGGTHVFWATGGNLVPAEERSAWLARGRASLREAARL